MLWGGWETGQVGQKKTNLPPEPHKGGKSCAGKLIPGCSLQTRCLRRKDRRGGAGQEGYAVVKSFTSEEQTFLALSGDLSRVKKGD